MDFEQINNKIEEKFEYLNRAWEHFKNVNDERLSEIQVKGSSDPLTEIKLDKINTILNEVQEQKSKINNIEIAMARPFSNENLVLNSEDLQYKSAFYNYLTKGLEDELFNFESKKDLTTSIDSDSTYGGHLLMPNLQKIITENIEENCMMRKLCSIQEISSSSFDVLIGSSMEPSWLGENGVVNDTDTSSFVKKTIPTFDLVAQPKVSQKLLDDVAINLEEWLAIRLADDFIGAEENAFINGTGSVNNKPKGILSYVNEANGITPSVGTGTGLFSANDILDLYYSLDDKYLNNATFLMSRTVIKEIRKLKDSVSGQYLWNSALLDGQRDTLVGCPVYTSAYMPTLATESNSIILGDFKYYQIVDRIGIRILRDPFTAKPYIRFYTTKRLGGDVVDIKAFKVLKCK